MTDECTPSEQSDVMKYQVWPGSNIFCMRGRLIFSTRPSGFILAIILTLIPTVASIIVTNYKITISILFLVTFGLMLFTAFRDPGIVPRVDTLFAEEEIQQIPFNQKQMAGKEYFFVDTSGFFQSCKQCETCFIYKVKSMRHCRKCDNCVCLFDHHCVWLNNCIGKKNYLSFIIYLFSLEGLIIFSIVTTFYTLVDETIDKNHKGASTNDASKEVLENHPLSVPIIVYGFIFLGLVSTLLLFHLYLIKTGQSTAGFTKRKSDLIKKLHFPFLISLRERFFILSVKSYVNFREFINQNIPKQNGQSSNNQNVEMQLQIQLDQDDHSNYNKIFEKDEPKRIPVLKQTTPVLIQSDKTATTFSVDGSYLNKCLGDKSAIMKKDSRLSNNMYGGDMMEKMEDRKNEFINGKGVGIENGSAFEEDNLQKQLIVEEMNQQQHNTSQHINGEEEHLGEIFEKSTFPLKEQLEFNENK